MAKKDKILKSVLKLVNRSGFYHLSMKKIAEEAGIAAGTIYLYFKGKEELINDLYKMVVSEYQEALLSSYNEDQPVKDKIISMSNMNIDFFLKNPDNFSFIEQYTYAPMLFKENQEQNFIMIEPAVKILEEGKKEGIVRDMPNEVILSIIHGAINTAIKMHLAKKIDLNNGETRQAFFDTLWHSVFNKK